MNLRRLLFGLAALAAAALLDLDPAPAAAQGCPAASSGVTFQTNELGSSCEVPRNKYDTGALLSLSSAVSATPTVDHQSLNGRGLKCVVGNLTMSGGGSFTVAIQGKDAASGAYYPLVATPGLTSTASGAAAVLTVYPGIATVAGVSANDVVPRFWRINPVIAGGATVTATVGCTDIP